MCSPSKSSNFPLLRQKKQKNPREDFSNKQVSFATAKICQKFDFLQKTSRGVFFSKNFYRSLLKVFPKSSHCRKKSVWVILQLKNNTETFNINEKTSQILSRVLVKPFITRKDFQKSSLEKLNIVTCKSISGRLLATQRRLSENL